MKFPVFTVMSILMVGLFIILYIMFNFGFHNPDTGAFTILDSHRDDMMNPTYSNWARELLDYNHSWWGTGFCVLIIMVIVCGFIDVLRNPKEG